MTAELQRDAVAAMTDAAVLGHGPRLEHCGGGDVHPQPNPAAAPPAIQESRGSAPTRAAEDSLVPRALSTGAPASGGGRHRGVTDGCEVECGAQSVTLRAHAGWGASDVTPLS